MIRLTRALWGTGKEVAMDSDFCVLKVILETIKRGVYGSALTKNRRYWTRGIMDMKLAITSGQEILVVWDVVVVNVTRKSLIFLF